MSVDYAIALMHVRPGARWTLNGDSYDALVWLDAGDPPTQSELDAAWPAINYGKEVDQVEAARRARYQAETDGLFFAAQREDGDLTAWKAAVDQIKADLPYPEEPK
jgi:hypothetical protein